MTDDTPRSGTPPCIAADSLWENFAEGGSAALAERQFTQSWADWQAAARVADSFQPTDPRRAASRTGLAIAGYAAGVLMDGAAELELRTAAQAWQVTSQWLDAMTVELGGRSSLFHFRLERKHADSYRQLARAEHQRLADAGAAACAVNLALIIHHRIPDEAARLYRHAIAARSAGLGVRDIGHLAAREGLRRLILTTGGRPADGVDPSAEMVLAAMRDPLSPLTRWKSESQARMTDRRRLVAAVYLSPILIRP